MHLIRNLHAVVVGDGVVEVDVDVDFDIAENDDDDNDDDNDVLDLKRD
jgi:hypothetical protein